MAFRVKHTITVRLSNEWQEFDDDLFIRRLPNGNLQIAEQI